LIMHLFGPNELLEDVIKKGLCIGCGACVDLCPYFKNYKGKTTMIFPCTLPQGRCHAYCPKAEVDLDELSSRYRGAPYEGNALGHYRDIVTSRAGDKMDKGPFQAGGTVSSLMAFALKTGRINAAVVTDRKGLVPVPRLVTRHEGVIQCAASKFMAAPTLAALNQGIREGYSKVGVVGTPCQVTSVAQMRSNPLENDDFEDPVSLVVGLFCTWALDARKLIAYLSERLDISSIHGMDIPPPPSEIMIIDTGDRKMEIPLDEIRPLVPLSCHICPDMTSEWADVSVGVLEGKPEWNTLIIRTEKGQELVENACKEGYLIREKISDQNLDHLSLAAANKKKRGLVRAKEEGVLNNPEGERRSALRINNAVVEKIIESS
jgi:coenzyme F420 hydrogenase subunit beta